MYEIIFTIHTYVAYVVLAILLLVFVNAAQGWFGNKTFTLEKDYRIGLFGLIFAHIQLLIGLILYFVSAKGLNTVQELGMGDMGPAARLLAVEHPFVNILAVILITVGWSRHKKFLEAKKKFKSITIFYGLGLLFIVSRLPWGQWLN